MLRSVPVAQHGRPETVIFEAITKMIEFPPSGLGLARFALQQNAHDSSQNAKPQQNSAGQQSAVIRFDEEDCCRNNEDD